MLVTYLVQCLVYTGKPYLGRGDEASPPPRQGGGDGVRGEGPQKEMPWELVTGYEG